MATSNRVGVWPLYIAWAATAAAYVAQAVLTAGSIPRVLDTDDAMRLTEVHDFLAGQNWSLLTLNSKGITPRNEVPPATIDAQYVVGFNWARQPQIRIVKNWNKEFWLAASVENPQTTFAANASTAAGITVGEGI